MVRILEGAGVGAAVCTLLTKLSHSGRVSATAAAESTARPVLLLLGPLLVTLMALSRRALPPLPPLPALLPRIYMSVAMVPAAAVPGPRRHLQVVLAVRLKVRIRVRDSWTYLHVVLAAS